MELELPEPFDDYNTILNLEFALDDPSNTGDRHVLFRARNGALGDYKLELKGVWTLGESDLTVKLTGKVLQITHIRSQS